MSKVIKVELWKLIEFQRWYDLPKSSFVKWIYPVVSSNWILWFHNEFKVKWPWITIWRSWTVGMPQYIEYNFFPHNTSLFIKDFKWNNVKYIYYLIQILWLNNKKSGSWVPTMNRNHLHPLKVLTFEDTKYQQKIASVLSNLDSKIELNNKINIELEKMAKTLYDYWFVQFDFPDENWKPYKSSGGKMVWSEELKREIPEGWEVKKLWNEIEIQRGISYTSKEINWDWIPMINLNSFNLDGTYKAQWIKIYSGKFKHNNIVKSWDLLIAATDVTREADIIGKAILVPDYYKNELLFSMDIAKIISKNIPSSFLMMLFNSNHYHNYIKWYATWTIVLHLNLDWIKRYNLEIPPSYLLKKFDDLYQPIANKIYLSSEENKKLAELRDGLLPMLMNGQVSVK